MGSAWSGVLFALRNFTNVNDAAFVIEGVLFVVTLIDDRDAGAGVEESQLAQAVGEDVEGESLCP